MTKILLEYEIQLQMLWREFALTSQCVSYLKQAAFSGNRIHLKFSLMRSQNLHCNLTFLSIPIPGVIIQKLGAMKRRIKI